MLSLDFTAKATKPKAGLQNQSIRFWQMQLRVAAQVFDILQTQWAINEGRLQLKQMRFDLLHAKFLVWPKTRKMWSFMNKGLKAIMSRFLQGRCKLRRLLLEKKRWRSYYEVLDKGNNLAVQVQKISLMYEIQKKGVRHVFQISVTLVYIIVVRSD